MNISLTLCVFKLSICYYHTNVILEARGKHAVNTFTSEIP